jgi:nitrogen regulatory protein PII 2
MLKELTAVIRPGRWSRTLQALEAAGFGAVTRQRVMGRGRQRGLAGEGGGGIPLLPKWMVTLVLEDQDVERAVAAVIAANQQGEIGDGKIFICPLEQAQRVRTQERGHLALH